MRALKQNNWLSRFQTVVFSKHSRSYAVSFVLLGVFSPAVSVSQSGPAEDELQALANLPVQFIFDESLQPDGIVIPFPVKLTTDEISDRLLRNAFARVQHGVDRVEAFSKADFGTALSGAGVNIGVWDGGLIFGSHSQIEGRVRFGEFPAVDVLGTENVFNWHATHVAGSIGADGLNSAASKGMAASAIFESYDFNNNLTEIETALSTELNLSNHSYGPVLGWRFLSPSQFPTETIKMCNAMLWVGKIDDLVDRRFGRYVTNSQEIDRIIHIHDGHLAVVAAGNDGGIVDDPRVVFDALVANGWLPSAPGGWDGTHCAFNGDSSVVVTKTIRPRDGGPQRFDLIGGMGVAKNVLTVGAAIDLDVGFENSEITITEFSSSGPVDDGRIKPDVVTNGELLTSIIPPSKCLSEPGCIAGGLTGADRSMTDETSGTSMATPVTTGILALLNEFAGWDEVLGRSLDAAEQKALIIFGVDSPTLDGAPTYRYGWGMIDALVSYTVLDPNESDAVLTSAEVKPGATDLRLATVFLDDAHRSVRTTVVWTDVAGLAVGEDEPNNLRTPALVNDFDTVLVSPSGKTYFPWSLNPDVPDALATREGPNNVDNVEVIDVPKDAYEEGEWTLMVSARATNPETVKLAVVAGHVAR